LPFNSLNYLIFFPFTFIIFFLIKGKHRYLFLLLSGYFFYSFSKIEYLLLLLLITFATYYFGNKIYAAESIKKKRTYLFLIVFVNISLLLFFKYLNFTISIANNIFSSVNVNFALSTVNIAMPLGISYLIFQSLTYPLDIYRGSETKEKSFFKYSLFVSFFPQVAAGPIERSRNILNQFNESPDYDYSRVNDGLRRILIGFFKKVVVADRLAPIVNLVYDNPEKFKGIHFIIATLLFTIQIYCDFSGYSDIAIGTGKIFGIKLMENFKSPYFSKTISEFWTRWHISFSSWLRDYIFLPVAYWIAGKYSKKNSFNIGINYLSYITASFITMIICGIWHGAAWTFILWGFLQGFYLVFGFLTKSYRKKIKRFIHLDRNVFFNKLVKILITFCMINFSFIIFRANNLYDAFYIVSNLFNGTGELLVNFYDLSYIGNLFGSFGLYKSEIPAFVIILSFFLINETYGRNINIFNRLNDKPFAIRWAVYYFLIFSIIFLGAYNSNQQFLYVQF
jgi:alginate O-acetyltransferase complex protein AlgI